MTGLVFVTAPTDLKTLNRALTFLRDWEYGDGAFVQTIITTRNAYELEPAAGYLTPTLVPLPEDFDNAWVNASLADIEAYMLDTHRSIARYNARINTTLFLVLDSEALAKDEIVLYKRFYDFASGTYLDKFKITRLPLEQAHAMHANLDINNMEFESYVEWDRKRGPRGEGWMVYRGLMGSGISAKVVAKREAELERLRVLGLVD